MKLEGKFVIKAIKKKTSAKFFKELKVGDEIKLAYSLSGYYESAPTIDIYKDGKYMHSNNALQLKNNLSNFEVEQLSDYSKLLDAENLLYDAQSLLSDIHGYDTDTYRAISEYFHGEEE